MIGPYSMHQVSSQIGSSRNEPGPQIHSESIDISYTCNRLEKAPPVSTGTILTKPTATHPWPVEYLNGRLNEIITLNPFLNYTTRGEKFAALDKRPSVELITLDSKQDFDIYSYKHLMDTISPFLSCPTVGQLAHLDNPRLFTVTLIESNCKIKAVLVISMSHILGDASTYYQIYGMFNPDSQLFAMDFQVVKEAEFVKESEKLLSNENLTLVDYKSLAIVPGSLDDFKVFKVSSKAISTIKQRYKETHADDFLSTNDILTSALFCHTRAEIGHAVMNLRQRLGLSKTLAGNYSLPFPFLAQDFESPENIRKVITNLTRLSKNAPQSFNSLVFVSNWTSIYQHLDLGFGIRAQGHFPLFKSVPFKGWRIFRNGVGQGICILAAGFENEGWNNAIRYYDQDLLE